MKRIGLWLAGLAAALAGGSLIEMAVRDPDFELASRIFSGICGLILLAGGALILYINRPEGKKDIIKEFRDAVFPDFTAPGDSSEEESMITRFRSDLRDFFHMNGNAENSPIQHETTQIYWNILDMQRKRLRKKNIDLDFVTERKQYGDAYPIRKSRFFDGKYIISSISEEIDSKRIYSFEGKKIHTKIDSQVAHYTVTDSKRSGDGQIVCPGCGHPSTRENLIDGCDFCRTRFSVEDLGTKMSGFALRDDYEVWYSKYQSFRKKFGAISFAVCAVPAFVWSLFFTVPLFISMIGEAGFVMSLTASVFSTLFVAGAAGLFGMYGFQLGLFPVIQLAATTGYYSKKAMERIRKERDLNARAAEAIRKTDPLFSLEDFLSGVQSKLEYVHFADSGSAVNAFSLGDYDMSGCLAEYGDVIDMEADEILIDRYAVEGGMQKMNVSAELTLLKFNGARAESRRETVVMQLVKSAACKTQSVCAPSVLRCKGCGASLSLLEGKRCLHCGRDMGLENYDWVIARYAVKK